jgi:hypothetical protein
VKRARVSSSTADEHDGGAPALAQVEAAQCTAPLRRGHTINAQQKTLRVSPQA